ncbi:MAG: tRNA pseudouridine(38-40) synthase TruA [Neomegalonema sp.]|nr:tRNA pseudouridine(38-40) synthase TruA [Neomegalonema sp.]
MPRFKLTIEYHGGPFVGWQRQDEGRSVQGALEAALGKLGEADPVVTGAGRTDAGVHAYAQVAHLDTARAFEGFRLAEALNAHLRPHPVAVLSAEPVHEAFHARFDAIERRYIYRIIERRAPLALEAGLAWQMRYPLDVEAMNQAAQSLLGRHDFTTFRSTQCQAQSPVKTLDHLHVSRMGSEIQIEVRARSFLHNQVRSFVGTLERVGAGRWSISRVKEALYARNRAACGPVAPAHGLYLAQVLYPDAEETG